MVKRVHVLVGGRVQNVGFRMFVLRAAEQLGVSGWVRNVPDGRQVELEAEGEEDLVDQLVARVRVGPLGARVQECQVEPRTPQGEHPARFRVL